MEGLKGGRCRSVRADVFDTFPFVLLGVDDFRHLVHDYRGEEPEGANKPS